MGNNIMLIETVENYISLAQEKLHEIQTNNKLQKQACNQVHDDISYMQNASIPNLIKAFEGEE